MLAALAMLTAATPARSGSLQQRTTAGAPPPVVWAVDPAVAGSSLPPVGRSLFDHVFARRDGPRTIVDVPFPFRRLVQHLEGELASEASGASPVKQVMIPLGRSLQRTAAAPAYFARPRVVAAVDGQPRSGPSVRSGSAGRLLRDRLYLGYHEAANVLEVISYNEDAGRFEFQVVRDYRAGGTRQVAYANRALCTACHQNAGPIFSRALWSETHANPTVAALLSRDAAARYGVDLAQGIDVPYAIDIATDRANLLAAYQWLWRNGCDAGGDGRRSAQCRGGMLVAALQYRLAEGQGFDDAHPAYRQAVAIVEDNGRKRWPGGLAIPNPDLPNRDSVAHRYEDASARAAVAPALAGASGAQANLAEAVDVAAAFDPLVLRAPLERWQLASPEPALRNLVAGLAGFFSDEDVARLNDHLVRSGHGASPAMAAMSLTCAMRAAPRQRNGVRVDFRCKPPQARGDGQVVVGRLGLEGTRVVAGSLDRLLVPDGDGVLVEVRDVDVASGSIAVNASGWTASLRLARGPRHVRGPDGSRVSELRLQGDGPFGTIRDTAVPRSFTGTARVAVLRDFVPVREAIDSMVASANAPDDGTPGALANAPFRRAAVLGALSTRLGRPDVFGCCDDPAGLPPAVVDAVAPIATDAGTTAGEVLLYRHCAVCHRSADPFPPNFLAGDSQEVRGRIAHCAPRIFVRLAMGQRHGDVRKKTPMPPSIALARARLTEAAWRGSSEFAALTTYIANLLLAETGKAADADDLLRGGYERLRECLPGTG